MAEAKHERDESGICWIVRTVKGEIAWTLCGRASYEAVTRCGEHSPVEVATNGDTDDSACRRDYAPAN
jgi:hypothetical protein